MNNKAFTLIESLLVLMIASLVLSLSPRVGTASQEFAFALFLDDLLTEIHTAQSYAVISGKSVVFEVLRPVNARHYATFTAAATSEAYVNRKLFLPQGSKVIQGYSSYIKSGSGYLQPDSIIMDTARYRYTIKIQLGSGRYVVEKVKK
ncbi:Hypothetical protein Tpal_907 [Trichococcus palustris]|uniref:Uncharacterized protein n=1 Tax=Trichococcus palustris TaxID=140314 RepID=A0A143YHZ7_9LACT|nr:prepilin-type N-terminal cleavage/methylation domain-containing protein [Trichococcus palustris]CZQ87515.1 Hypothetical protein Tpal_907 [Trichococcus palustris]SFK78709.1 competence protein ComGD [Trichococcus palustris]